MRRGELNKQKKNKNNNYNDINNNWQHNSNDLSLQQRDKSLKTVHTCVRAEHSTYLTALSMEASFSPLSVCRGRCLFFASFSMVLLSSRRSICVPTIRKGVLGQWCEISGTHCRGGEVHFTLIVSLMFFN